MKITSKLQTLLSSGKDEKQQQLDQARDLEEYQMEFEPKSYVEENKSLFKISNISGYFFQLFSAATAAATVFFFVYDLSGNKIISCLSAIVFLGLLEAAKRIVSSRFFTQYVKSKGKHRFNYGMLTIMILLTSWSVFLSVSGANRTIQEILDNPTLLTADVGELKAQIEQINKQIATAENQTNSKGKILYKSIDNIEALVLQKTKLQARIFEIEDKTEIENGNIETENEKVTNEKAYYAAGATLIFEFFFLLCLWYEKYYKWRCVIDIEINDNQGLVIELDSINQAPTLPDPKVLMLENTLKHLQNQNEQMILAAQQQQQKMLSVATTNDDKANLALLQKIEALEQEKERLATAAKQAKNKALQAKKRANKKKAKAKKKKTKQAQEKPQTIGFFNRSQTSKVAAKSKQPKTVQSTDNEKGDDFNSQGTKIINIENSKTCLHCEKQYIYNHKKQLYCCEQCRKKAYKAKRKNK